MSLISLDAIWSYIYSLQVLSSFDNVALKTTVLRIISFAVAWFLCFYMHVFFCAVCLPSWTQVYSTRPYIFISFFFRTTGKDEILRTNTIGQTFHHTIFRYYVSQESHCLRTNIVTQSDDTNMKFSPHKSLGQRTWDDCLSLPLLNKVKKGGNFRFS